MLYTFDSANANAPSKRDTQYFEMVGNRATTTTVRLPDDAALPALGAGNGHVPPLDQYKWELYNITEDYSEYDDLAARIPTS